jgi:hypothetical protein
VPPGERNVDNCGDGEREYKDGTEIYRERNIFARTNNNIDGQETSRESCASEIKRKGTSRKVPQLEESGTGSAHHLSGSG